MLVSNVTLQRKDGDVEVEFKCNYTPPSKGSRDQYGVPLEPDWDAEYEIYDVTDMETGEDLDNSLTKEEMDSLIDHFINFCDPY